ncbi:uncharacterized protein LOC116209179 [Punica granatum]|uniref:Uncharacterized protein LOC116209179 n=1 Tax=Punica granatum TaxID=22663 RepID=A0A6P8DMN7_PUNGR|nr:uncharacterized protein LOC116209179 [Punica granatum]
MTVEIGKQFSDEHMYSQKMKEKATRLKTMYKQSIRVRWDEDTNTINASPDVWDMFIKKNKAFKTFRTRGCKHYRLLNELFSASTAIDALRISSTDRLRTSDEERQLHEEFLSISKKKHKQTINLEKGSDESDDPVQVQKPIISGSRSRVRKGLHRQAHNYRSAWTCSRSVSNRSQRAPHRRQREASSFQVS